MSEIKDYEVKLIDFNKEIIDYISKKHYSQTCPYGTKYCFGLYKQGERIGVLLLGSFSRDQARAKYVDCLEFTRLFIEDVTPKNAESFFIGKCLKWLRRNTKIKGIISYADPNVGHTGAIYKATNFILIGKTGTSYHYVKNGKQLVHKRGVWERAKKNNIKEKTQARREGLEKVKEYPKYIYFYAVDKKYKIPTDSKTKKYQLIDYRVSLFNKWSRELAWIYGLILGDGSVHEGKKTKRILFGGNLDTVKKFEKIFKVKNKNKFESGIYHTYIDSVEIVKWFKQRGIVGKKSYNLPWPKDIPEEYMWDFVRGLIDTDGSFRWDDPKKNNRRGRLKLILGFSSSTKKFCEDFLKWLNIDLKVKTGKKEMNGKEFLHYSFKLGFEKSIEVLDKVYDCPEEIRNKERYEKYLKGKKLLQEYNKGCVKCGKKIHTKNLCMEHMWQEKLKDKKPLYCHCGKKALTRKSGLCSAHYSKQRRLKE